MGLIQPPRSAKPSSNTAQNITSRPLLISDHPANHTLEPILSLLLNLCKPHDTTALTLYMLNQSTQQLIVPATSSAWASIDMLLVDRATDMRVEGPEGRKLFWAEVACICVAVPRTFCCNGWKILVAGHRQHRASNDVVAVHALYHVVDLMSVEVGLGTSAGFKVDL